MTYPNAALAAAPLANASRSGPKAESFKVLVDVATPAAVVDGVKAVAQGVVDSAPQAREEAVGMGADRGGGDGEPHARVPHRPRPAPASFPLHSRISMAAWPSIYPPGASPPPWPRRGHGAGRGCGRGAGKGCRGSTPQLTTLAHSPRPSRPLLVTYR